MTAPLTLDALTAAVDSIGEVQLEEEEGVGVPGVPKVVADVLADVGTDKEEGYLGEREEEEEVAPGRRVRTLAEDFSEIGLNIEDFGGHPPGAAAAPDDDDDDDNKWRKIGGELYEEGTVYDVGADYPSR